MQANATPNLLHSESSSPCSPQWRHHTGLSLFSHSSLSPPFHHAPRVQPTPGVCNGLCGDQAIENAQSPRRGWKNISMIESERSTGLGFSIGECPQKIGWWGAKRVEERETRLTMSAFSLPQLTQMHSNIFLTFMMKPKIQR